MAFSVFLAAPGPHPQHWGNCFALMQHPPELGAVYVHPHVSSLLPHGFNRLWAQALNLRKERGLTHFAMLHTDIVPPVGWLWTLLQEQQAYGVDVLSCVVPLKDERGVTSTALYGGEGKLQRLTMAEVMQLPVTFMATDAKGLMARACLLVNTGCWVCDFTQPWVEQMSFRFQDAIVRQAEGVFEAQTFSEDWDFSLKCASRGVSVAATRVVPLAHMDGQTAYRNDHAWGTWQTDEGGA